MSSSSGEETDISESEIEEYEEKTYEELRSGRHFVRRTDVYFNCAFCVNKKKRVYVYDDLLRHASGVGKSTSEKRTTIDRAKHLALKKYLEKDVVVPDSLPKSEDDSAVPADCSHTDQFVWPWIGIVVNFTTDECDIGKSGSKLRDEYRKRGFNPLKVRMLSNDLDVSKMAIVEFGKDWAGFYNALSFDRTYEVDHHGKKDWHADTEIKFGLYAWIARADDYNSDDIIGKYLSKKCDIKTISEIMEEEVRKRDALVSELLDMIEIKNKQLMELEGTAKFQSLSIS